MAGWTQSKKKYIKITRATQDKGSLECITLLCNIHTLGGSNDSNIQSKIYFA